MEITIEKIHNGTQSGAQALKNLKTVRVAVYARVSTDKEIQLHSLEEQMKAFQTKIGQHPGWVLVDVYADEGISGTSVKKRKEFLRMMEDCEAGKVDYIMTKSVSRFARNTVECLSYVRHLKNLGVQVYFEKEGVDTGTAISELILTVMAGFAQEESRSISENLKWGIRKRFEKGETRWCRTYGYRKTEDGEIVIDPAEAGIVRMVFDMYRKGTTIPEILERLSGTAALWGGEKWNKTTLQYLLQSEKYIGDAKLQKWISSDHISHRSVRNDATIVPGYYAKNHHVPIIDRHTYEQVQRIMELRAPRQAPSRYPYYDTEIICPLCGKKMTTGVMRSKDNKRIIGWIVREVFNRFAAGQNYTEIVDDLEKMGAKSKRGKKRFSVETLRNMLTNETYVGDKRLQKQPPKDYLTKKPDPNREYKTYYLKDDHEPLIDRETWDKVQEILNKREEEAKIGIYRTNGEHHELYGKIFCGECGAPFVRRTFRDKKGNHYKAWNCRERQKGSGCVCHAVREEKLMEMVAGKDYERITVYEDRVEVE